MKSKGKVGQRGKGSVILAISLLIVVLVCFASNKPVVADAIPLTFNVETDEDGGHVGLLTVWTDIDMDAVIANPEEQYGWYLPTGPGEMYEGGIDIYATGEPGLLMAHVGGASIQLQGDPSISLGFSVTAGQYASSFSFASPVMNFAPISNTEAYAEATISPTSGTTVWGSYPGQKPFQALYNGSTNFAYLIASPITWPVGAEMTGPTALPGSISSMQSTWQFIVSAQGMASGTSFYEIEPVPEPATIALLGMGGLFLLRRRKRK